MEMLIIAMVITIQSNKFFILKNNIYLNTMININDMYYLTAGETYEDKEGNQTPNYSDCTQT